MRNSAPDAVAHAPPICQWDEVFCPCCILLRESSRLCFNAWHCRRIEVLAGLPSATARDVGARTGKALIDGCACFGRAGVLALPVRGGPRGRRGAPLQPGLARARGYFLPPFTPSILPHRPFGSAQLHALPSALSPQLQILEFWHLCEWESVLCSLAIASSCRRTCLLRAARTSRLAAHRTERCPGSATAPRGRAMSSGSTSSSVGSPLPSLNPIFWHSPLPTEASALPTGLMEPGCHEAQPCMHAAVRAPS